MRRVTTNNEDDSKLLMTLQEVKFVFGITMSYANDQMMAYLYIFK